MKIIKALISAILDPAARQPYDGIIIEDAWFK